MKRQRHPHILRLEAAFVDGSDLWMIVPLVKGGSLESLLQRGHQQVEAPVIPSLCPASDVQPDGPGLKHESHYIHLLEGPSSRQWHQVCADMRPLSMPSLSAVYTCRACEKWR